MWAHTFTYRFTKKSICMVCQVAGTLRRTDVAVWSGDESGEFEKIARAIFSNSPLSSTDHTATSVLRTVAGE